MGLYGFYECYQYQIYVQMLFYTEFIQILFIKTFSLEKSPYNTHMQIVWFLAVFSTIILGWTAMVVFLIIRLFPILSRYGSIGYSVALVSSTLFIIGIIGSNMGASSFFGLIYAYGAWWLWAITIAGFVAIAFLIIGRIFGLVYSGTLVAVGFLTLVIALNIVWTWLALSPKVTEYRVPIPGEHGWHSKRIVMVADTHYGNIWGKASAEKLVERINSLSPEIVLLPWDLFDGPEIDFFDALRPFTSIQAPKGVLFANGNHEEYRNTEAMLDAMSRTDTIHNLNNRSVTIDGLTFAGVTYRSSDTASGLVATLDAMQLSWSTILLKHKPTLHTTLMKYPIALVVSGHTHRGQMWPFSLITDMIYGKYSYGQNIDGTMNSITTSGVGSWWPPQRLGTRSEIVVIYIE